MRAVLTGEIFRKDLNICHEIILGYRIVAADVETCIAQVVSWMDDEAIRKVVFCANPHSLVGADNDHVFKQALQSADLLIPDGAGVVLASRVLGGGIHKRVTGTDIYSGLNRALNDRGGYGCFFVGSTEETLEKIRKNLKRDYPNIRFAGSYSPPFKREFSEEDGLRMVEAVNAASPDVLWVGMTAPKQEKWIYHNRERLNVKFIGAIGAVFDFYAGTVKRSHPFFRSIGLEWLPRLIREPRRLWRRNFVSSPRFICMIMAQRLGLRRSEKA